MSGISGKLRARRCLVPQALRGVLKGPVPSRLARHLKLSPGTRFEMLAPPCVEVGSHTEDRFLLDHLSALVGPAISSRRLDLAALAFPTGVNPIDLRHLPLHTRTRNCLGKADLLSAAALRQQSLGSLLAIPAFGAKSLVDLLTAVEAANWTTEPEGHLREEPAALSEFGTATLSPRLTREARLLGNEPWAKEVSLYDIRLGARLLKDAEAAKEVFHALAERRISPGQKLFPDPLRQDLDLLRCPLLTRTKNRLRVAGLTRLSDLASLTVREARELRVLGNRALADLLSVLDVCRFPASAAVPKEREPTVADFCEAVVNRSRDAWFPDRLADRIHLTRALGIGCLSLSLEEELRDLAAAASPSCPEVIAEYLGWDGLGLRTLEAVAKVHGVTRERIRQKVAALAGRLSMMSAWAPILRRALDACGRASPRPAAEVAAQLQEKGVATAPFHPQGLLTAAEAFGLAHPFSLRRIGENDWFFQGDEEMLLRKGVQLAGSVIGACGACSLGELRAELAEQSGHDLAEELLREWIGRLPDTYWLDAGKQWFRFNGSASSLETILWKILSVSPEIQLGELREGLTRHYRYPSALPSTVLRELWTSPRMVDTQLRV